MTAEPRATGRDVILDIVENMRVSQEPLLYTAVAPACFEVTLSPADYDRLESLFPSIVDEARRALSEALARDNRDATAGWRRAFGFRRAAVQPAQSGWSIEFFRDENDEVRPGDIVVRSDYRLPPAPDFGAGQKTRRIVTSRIGGELTTRSELVDTPPISAAPADALPPAPPTLAGGTDFRDHAPAAAPIGGGADHQGPPPVPLVSAEPRKSAALATISYEDKSGRHTHEMTGHSLVVGRGGAGYYVDLKLDTVNDVSREHVRIRYDHGAGQFFIKDLSAFGTTVDGKPIASSIDLVGGKRDLGIEVPLPAQARIGLADAVTLEFRAGG